MRLKKITSKIHLYENRKYTQCGRLIQEVNWHDFTIKDITCISCLKSLCKEYEIKKTIDITRAREFENAILKAFSRIQQLKTD